MESNLTKLEVNMGRMEERMGNVEKGITEIKDELKRVSSSIEYFQNRADERYATKTQVVGGNVVVGFLASLLTFLIGYFITHR